MSYIDDAYSWITEVVPNNSIIIEYKVLRIENCINSEIDGEFVPPNKISVNILRFREIPIEILVLFHELGHYFNYIESPEKYLVASEKDKEYIADKYMIEKAKQYGFENEATNLAKKHKETVGYSYEL
jgi:hypothetical protein